MPFPARGKRVPDPNPNPNPDPDRNPKRAIVVFLAESDGNLLCRMKFTECMHIISTSILYTF